MNSIKPRGYWENWGNVERELKEAIKMNGGKFPTQTYLKNIGVSSLSFAINRYFGGFQNVKQIMGYENTTKQNGYWKKWENVETELNKAIERNEGVFPTKDVLIDMGFTSLPHAVKHFGGLSSVKEKMGYENTVKQNGYWKSFENLESELEKIIEMNKGEFPTENELIRMNLSSICNAFRYHGGFRKVREKMGYEGIKRENNYWENFKNIKKELDNAIKRNKGKFPTHRELINLGFSSLASAIGKHHGGFWEVREKMGYEGQRRSKGYLENWENYKKEMNKAIVMNEGNFPTYKNLIHLGFSSLGNSARYHGGLYEVREKIGYNEKISRQLAKELEEIVRDYE